jgi:hypothetical protein
VAVAVDAERRVEVGVAERLRRGVDSGDAPELGRAKVWRAIFVG